MIRNFFRIAFRNLWRQKGMAAINIFGLAIGIATCIVILLFVQHELSYDRYNKKADRMVRVVFHGQVKGEKMREANVFPPVAQTLLRDYPEVQEATRINFAGQPIVMIGSKTFKGNSLALVDSNFFNVFTLPLIEGKINTVLAAPNNIVITKALAKKFFGNENPMGKVIGFKNNASIFRVSGLIDKVPENSHFHFDMFIPLTNLPDAASTSWMTSGYYTYLVLPEGYDYKKLEARLPQTVNKYMGPQIQQAMGISLGQFRSGGNDVGLQLQPLTDIHLHSDFTNDFEAGGDVRYVYIFSAIALFMLLIACINFMNLSTANADNRAAEVGMRKVLGAMKGLLIRQFLLESLLLTALAMALAVIFVQLALPLFNQLAGRQLNFSFSTHPWIFPSLLLIGLITGLLAGSYPAFFLSSFKPVEVLKGNRSSAKGSVGLRSGLVIFQFFISITLIISTAIVYKQLAYIQNKKLGYDKEQVLILPEAGVLGQKETVLREQLQQDPRVVSVASSGYIPAGPSSSNNFFLYENSVAAQVKTLRYEVDYNYIQTLGMQMAEGRNFSRDFVSDSTAIIVNETAARALGWGKNVIGKNLVHVSNDATKTYYHLIGVVKDFNFKSLHDPISPLVMTLSNGYGPMLVKTRTHDIAALLPVIKAHWDKLAADEPFEYAFLDERFNNTYLAERNTGRILGLFAGLTIFVACLGLFGLATFMARKRNREIGIRKVLGASVMGIVSLLSKDFLKLVAVAFLLSAPFAWFIMNRWLLDFAYRVSISWWIFAAAAFAAVGITVLTIGFQAIQSAVANPVKSLRTE